MTSILYLGDSAPGTTSRHRADALRRIGHAVHHLDPAAALAPQLTGTLRSRIHFRSGYRWIQRPLMAWLSSTLGESATYDVVWVNGGELFGSEAAAQLRRYGTRVVLYCNDDVTGPRDGRRFDSVRTALPEFDLCVSVREPTVTEMKSRGAAHVLRVFMSYDEVVHAPFSSCGDIPDQFLTDVAFVGTWMRDEGREKVLLGLVECGLDVAIWGDRWENSGAWSRLKGIWRGPGLAGRDYVAACQGAKICIGLLSAGNRDLHTTRSLEIPYMGGLLCAQRTTEHQELYEEGVHAVFWGNVEECADVCKSLIEADDRRARIRLAGAQRVRALRVGNEDVCRRILGELSAIGAR